QLLTCLKLFSPARTSIHAIFFFPPYAFATAASMTRTLARQMSGPVPSPSMNGMIGLSGTESCPFLRVMGAPSFGTFIRSLPFEPARRFTQKLWKSLWKSSSSYRGVTLQLECFSELHHSRARAQCALQRRTQPSDYTGLSHENHRRRQSPSLCVGGAED